MLQITMMVEENTQNKNGLTRYFESVWLGILNDLKARFSNWPDIIWHPNQVMKGVPTIHLLPGAGALLDVDKVKSLLAAMKEKEIQEITLPLHGKSDIPQRDLPQNAGTRFRIESAADLIVLACHPATGPATRKALDQFPLDRRAMLATMQYFCQREPEVAILGPISVSAWRYLEDQVACRVRVIADGDISQMGLAASLFQDATPAEFSSWLKSLGHAIILDSRQLVGHMEKPTEEDYFWSDLSQPARVTSPALRRLTRIATESEFPIILGGPSLVNGALYALVEGAWQTGRDLNRGYTINW